MSAHIVNLHTSGNIQYQDKFILKIRFDCEKSGLENLKLNCSHLQSESVNWAEVVKTARATFYHINYYTMKEILRMHFLALKEPELDNIVNFEIDNEVDIDISVQENLSPQIQEQITEQEMLLASKVKENYLFNISI